MSHRLRMGILAALTGALAACGGGAKLPDLYILGGPAPATAGAVSQLDHPILEIERVHLPDYLDTTDIVTSQPDGRIVARSTARWGERLSVGVTRAVADGLEARLTSLAVTTAEPLAPPRWQLLIDVDSFEVDAGGAQSAGRAVLTARWTVLAGNQGEPLREEKVSLVQPIGQGSDPEVVAAMNQLVNQLVDRIAPAFDAEPRR
jgi:uncharacterized protein